MLEFHIMDKLDPEAIYRKIAFCMRTCYNSRDKSDLGGPKDQALIKKFAIGKGHLSVIECVHVSVFIKAPIGITRELIRHRVASFSELSTRYVDAKHFRHTKEIAPYMSTVMQAYRELKDSFGIEYARNILPLGMVSEIIITANLREWRHIFSLRCSEHAHPQMRELMLKILGEFNASLPVIFGDIYERYNK